MEMFQMVYGESTKPSFDGNAKYGILNRALTSFNHFGYLAQEGFELRPCKYFADRWQILYKGEYYNFERYTDLREAVIAYLECVASMVMSHKPSRKKVIESATVKMRLDESGDYVCDLVEEEKEDF